MKVSDSEDIMKLTPPPKIDPIKIWWRVNLYINTLTNDPPATYPKALQKNMNEKYGSGLPV